MDSGSGEKTPRRGEAGMHDDNTHRLGVVELANFLSGGLEGWVEGLLLRAVSHVAPAGSRSGSLLRRLGALARLFLLRTLATLGVPLCCTALLLRHKILQ
jgi:hypothetical protein